MRRVAAVATAVLVAALAACGREPQSTPEVALAAWVTAMNASRSDVSARRRAYELLCHAAQASLAERAARVTQLSGRDMHPWEMLAPGRFAMRFAFDPDGLSARIDGARAVVTARGRGGDRAEVPMRRENGRWCVDLELPPMQPIRGDGDAGM